MSYILDALKRAEQLRGGPARAIRAPRAFSAEGTSRRWPWLVGGAAGMAVLVVAIALWPTTVPPPPATTVPVDVTPRAELARPEPPPPAAEPRPSPPIDRRVPARVVPPPAERSTASRLAPPAAAERSKIGSLTPPPAPVERSAASRPVAPPVVRSAPLPAERLAPPPPEVARAAPPRPSAPQPAAPAGDVKAMAAKIALQVLSWAPEPKDRFVFLNGRRYGEGQKVDDQLLVERILEDGVVLSFQGERVTLKGR